MDQIPPNPADVDSGNDTPANGAPRGLTDRAVKALKPAAGRYEVWDEDVPGFGVRVAPSGLKTWVVRYRQDGRKRRLKLGNLPAVSLADARKLARQALAAVALGADPAADKHDDAEAATFGHIAAVYLERHAVNKRTGDEDRVPLSPQAAAIVAEMRAMRREGPWVFAGRLKGQHVTNVERAIDRARQREGLTHFTPHDLRRTAASLMTGLGIPRLMVKKLLNHADSDVTAIYDRHSYDAEKRSALETWGRRVGTIVADSPR